LHKFVSCIWSERQQCRWLTTGLEEKVVQAQLAIKFLAA